LTKLFSTVPKMYLTKGLMKKGAESGALVNSRYITTGSMADPSEKCIQ